MAIRPWVLQALQNTPPPPPVAEHGGTWDEYIKPAVMAPLHVLGAGYKGIGTLASALDNTVRTGDPLSGFKLPVQEQSSDLSGDVAAGLGFGESFQGIRDPFEVGADALRGAIGGKGARDVDPEWEQAFRAAAPVTTGVEAAGTLAGQFATQALLDPVMHGLAAASTRAGAGVLAEGAVRPTYNVLPEAVKKAFPTVGQAFEGGVPDALLSASPEAAGRLAKGLGAAFVPGMAISAAENLAQAPGAIREHGLLSPQAVETGGQGLVDAAFAGLGAYHALRGGHGTGESVEEIKQAQGEGEAQATPAVAPKAPYETPGVAWRRKSQEDLLTVTPEEQARLDDLNEIIPPSPDMELALEGKAPEVAVPPVEPVETSAPRGRKVKVIPEQQGPPDLKIESAPYEDVLGRAQADVAAQGHETIPPEAPLGAELPEMAAEALRSPLLPPEEKFSVRPRTPEEINQEMEGLMRGKRTKAVEKRLLDLRAEREQAQAPPTPATEGPDLLSALDEVKPLAQGGTGQAPTVSVPRLWEHVQERYAGDRAAFDRDLLALRAKGEIEAQKGDTGLSAEDYAGSTVDPAGGAGRLYAVTRRVVPEKYSFGSRELTPHERLQDIDAYLEMYLERPKLSKRDKAAVESLTKTREAFLNEHPELRSGNVEEIAAADNKRYAESAYTREKPTDEKASFTIPDEKTLPRWTKTTREQLEEARVHALSNGERYEIVTEPTEYRKVSDQYNSDWLRSDVAEHAARKSGGKVGEAKTFDIPRLKRIDRPVSRAERTQALREIGERESGDFVETLNVADEIDKALSGGEDGSFSVGKVTGPNPPVSAIIDRAREVWKDRIARTEALHDGGTRLHMRDGKRLEIHPTGEILGVGPDIANREGAIRGAWRPLGNADSYIRLVDGKATFHDFLHEAGHGAIWSQFNRSEQKAFFEQHRQEIFDKLKVDSRRMTEKQRAAAEEIVVERLAETAEKHLQEAQRGNLKAAPGWFKRLWDYITRIARAFRAPDPENLAKDFASGQIWDRGRGERLARRAGEWVRGESTPRGGAGEKFSAETAGARSSSELEAARKAWKEKGTESPWFRRWFGESKVTAPDGKPLTVYHGSRARFTEFSRGHVGTATDSGYLGEGFYFSDRATAGGYARMSRDAAKSDTGISSDAEYQGEPYVSVGKKSALYPSFLSLRRPLELYEKANPEVPHQALDREAHIREALGIARHEAPEAVTIAAKKQGYDGVIFHFADVNSIREGKPAYAHNWNEYVAFTPEQIKSAIGNQGTFSPTDPDIRYQVRPEAPAKDATSDAREALNAARREKDEAQAAARGLKGDKEKAAAARVREATKRVAAAEEAVRHADTPLDKDRAPVSILGQSPRDPRAGAEGPGAPPRVELRKQFMQELRKEQGKEPFDWTSNVPQARRGLIPKVQKMLDTMSPEQIFAKTAPSPEKVMAQDAFIAGRKADLEVLKQRKAEEIAKGKDDGRVNAEAIEAAFDLQIAEMGNILDKYGVKQIEYNTVVARTMSAMNDIMSAGRSLPDTFLRDIFKKHPNISPEKATALANLVRDGKFDELPEALFAAVEPKFWAKFLEYWKSGLVSAVGTQLVANPGGNILEGAARLAESPFGVITEAVASKFTGEARTRSFGEAGAEASAIKVAAPEAWTSFKADLGKIFRGEYGSLAELDEAARKKGLAEVLQYPPAIGAGPKWARKLLPTGNVGSAVRAPLYILSATDAMFRKLGVAAELGKLSHREAVAQLGHSASKEAIAAKAAEIAAGAREAGGEYEHLMVRAHEEAAKRVFQNDAPALRSVKSLRANLRPFGIPIGHFAIPFTDTPFNIFKMMIERSPIGAIGATKAWKLFEHAKAEGKVPTRELEKMRDNAIDLTARAALGTTMFGLFYGAAKAGMMTGAGPTDPKAKKALMETGWQPYSFKVGDTYIPFNRFEPVSSILGFSADAVEIANKGERESYVKKAAAAFMTNALSKTYLQGLSDAAGLIVDPERYGPDYMASLAGSLIPNIVAKGAQAIDPVMRETRPPGSGPLGQIAATMQSRVPGASMALPEQKTLTGEVRERPNAGSIAGAVSRFALPVQVTQRKAGSELQEEFARVGYTPPVPDRKIRVSGQDVVLAPSEQDKLAEEYQKASTRAERLMGSPAYKSAPDDADAGQRSKRKLLDRLYDEANDRFKARYASILRARARAKAAAQPRASA